MSGSNNLEIKISAQDSASAIIQKLTASVQTLSIALNYAANASTAEGSAAVNSYRQQIAAAEQIIEALRARGDAQKEVLAALKTEGETASQVYARMQEDAVGVERARQQALKESIRLSQQLYTEQQRMDLWQAAPRLRQISPAESSMRSQSTGSALAAITGAISGQKASEAAKAFEKLGDFERILGDTEYTVAYAAGQEKMVEATKAAMAQMEREIYAHRQLREELSIPAAPEGQQLRAMDGAASIGAVPRFLSRQQNPASGMAEDAARLAGGTRGLSSSMGHLIALFDELARGQRRAVFSTLGAAARDAGVGIGVMATSLSGLVAIGAGAAILHSAEAMGKWATEVKAAASATGMSVEQYSGLDAALRSLGLNGAEADASLRKLSQSLGEALANPASKAAEAFHNLGISQDQLIANGTNTYGALQLLANAYIRTADGANKTANMNELAGRGFERLVPLIQDGAGAMNEMTSAQEKLGTTLTTEGADKLEVAGNAVRSLGEVIRGEGIKAMEDWSSTIVSTTEVLKGLVEVIGGTIGAIGRMMSDIGKGMAMAASADLAMTGQLEAAKAVANSTGLTGPGSKVGTQQFGPPVPPKAAVGALTPPVSVLESMRLSMAQAEAAAGSRGGKPDQVHMAETEAAIKAMQQTLQTAQLTAAERTQIETELAQKTVTLENEKASAANKSANAGAVAARRAAKETYAEFANSEKQKIVEANGSTEQIIAIYDDWAAKATAVYQQNASVAQAIEREKTKTVLEEQAKRLRVEMQTTELTDRINRAQTAISVIQTNQRTGKGQVGDQAETAPQYQAEAADVQAKMDENIAKRQKLADAAGKNTDLEAQLQEQILQIRASSLEQIKNLEQKAAEASAAATQKMLAPFTSLFDQIGSQFEGLTSSLLKDWIAPQVTLLKQGLTSIKINEAGTAIHQAFQKFALDMIQDAAKSIENAASHAIAQSIDSSITGGIGDLLGKLLQKAFSSVISSVIGNTVGSAAGQAVGGAASGTLTSGVVTTALAANATSISSAITAANATKMAADTANTTLITSAITGTAAITDSLLTSVAVKPEALGFSYAGGGIVPSAAGGMVVGGNGATLARLHFNEMVLPAHISQSVQNMANRGTNGGAGNLTYSPTINGAGKGRGGTGMTRAEFSQMMSQHSGAMLGQARNMARNGFRAS